MSETFATIKARVDQSNSDSAYLNSNLYLIQEQASLDDVYEQFACPCGPQCNCRKYGCRSHWRLRANVAFPEFRDAFLRMFVPRLQHTNITLRLDNGEQGSGRVAGAVTVLSYLRNNWAMFLQNASSWPRTLLCSEWHNSFWQREWSAYDESVYWAKQWATLLPDTCVPYDTASRRAIRSCTGGAPPAYFDMLDRLRTRVIDLLNREGRTIGEFRELDAPGAAGLPFDHGSIMLPRIGFAYRHHYLPVDRPLSRVIDKFFYTPATQRLVSANPGAWPSADAPGNCSFRTLSGTGEVVTWIEEPGGYHVNWGSSSFTLTASQIETIMEEFFSTNEWKNLGASMTDPHPDGLGCFLARRFHGLKPRHA